MKLKYYINPNFEIPKVLKLFFVALSIFFFFSVVASASTFSDNFNDGNIDDWTSTMTTTFPDAGYDGSKALKHTISSGVKYTNHTLTLPGSYKHISFDFMQSAVVNSVYGINIISDDVNKLGVSYGGAAFTTTGFTGTTFVPQAGKWYHFDIYVNNTNNVHYIITNSSNGSIYIDETDLLTATNSDFTKVSLFAYLALTPFDIYIDNVYISASSVSSTSTNSITWGSDSYVKDDSGSYTWTITDTDWTETTLYIPYEFRAEIYKNGALDKSVALGSQTGTGYYTFADVGSYQIKLMKYWGSSYYLGGSGTAIGNDSITVRPQGENTIAVNSTIPVATNFTVRFSYGNTPSNVAYSGISAQKLATDGNYYDVSFRLFPQLGVNSISANTLYTINMIIYEEGVYRLNLEDFDKGVIASATTKAKAVNFPPSATNLTASFLNISSSTFMYDDGFIADSGIDYTNYTCCNYQFYLRTYNINRSIYAGERKIYRQVVHDLYQFISPSKPDSKRSVIVIETLEGQNTLRLVGRNTTEEVILASANYTISTIDADGYGLSLTKSEVCKGEELGITVIAPYASTLTIYKIKDGFSNLRETIRTYKVNSSSTAQNDLFLIKYSTVGDYTASLLKFDNNTIERDFKVSNCVTPTPTPTPESGAKKANDIANLLSMNVFWAFVMTFGMMAVIGGKMGETQNRDLVVVITGVFGMGAFTLIGWVPAWLTFSIIIGMFVIFAWQRSRDMNTGGG